MCVACQELTKLFNRAIKKAQVLDDRRFESQCKEKLNWIMSDIYEKDCTTAKILLDAFYSDPDDEINKDSDILDGKQWDEVLDAKFKPRPPIPSLPQDQQVPRTKFNTVKLDELDEIVKEIESGQISFKWTEDTTKEVSYKLKAEAEFETIAQKATCGHKWITYEGAGTKPPEVLCSKCGETQKNSKA